ncbi:MAG: GNAT family N-acetyltransferase [Chloroflexota bacterium]
MSGFKSQFTEQICSVTQEEWNGLVGIEYPFLRYEFLVALEESGSVSAETGWQPQHLIIRDQASQLVAVLPCYEKDHSYGEYVFDWSWANAYYQHGMNYYPKLLSAVPFTPAVGPRLVIDPEQDVDLLRHCAVQAVTDFCQRQRYSSWHLLFPQSVLKEGLDAISGEHSLMCRTGSQFHWYNRGYECFADYIGAMTSRKRKSVRKEREKVVEQGITFLHCSGQEITPELLDDFYLYYHATYMKRGQQGYLNRGFFELLLQTMPESLLFVFAQLDGRNIAVAFFLKGGGTLYGRYWGCLEEYKHLHFETCYYQGIDHCIDHNLAHFDAGAQGEHKIQRGFEPIPTYSYHWIAHPGFRDAINDYVALESQDVLAYIDDAATYLPFKQQAG